MGNRGKRFGYFMYVDMGDEEVFFKIFAYQNKINSTIYPGQDLGFKFIAGTYTLYLKIISNMREKYFNIIGPTCRELAENGITASSHKESKYYESLCSEDFKTTIEDIYNELKSEVNTLKLVDAL